MFRKTYELSENKTYPLEIQNISDPRIQSSCKRGLTNRTPMSQKTYELSEKQHMIFRKKNISTRNSKHIRPAYTVQL
jgi:hypothetical protein